MFSAWMLTMRSVFAGIFGSRRRNVAQQLALSEPISGLVPERFDFRNGVGPPHLDDEILVRVRAVELVPAEDALTSFSALRPRLTRWLADLDAVKAELKSPTLASTLELQYFDLLLRAHLKWLDGVEKALKKRVSEDRARKQEKRRRRR
jgi:hypothetical protein